MLNLDTKIYEIPLPISHQYHILCRVHTNGKLVPVVMTAITEEEEEKIDKLQDKFIEIERACRKFKIRTNHIYCYGEVDLYNEDDLKNISKFNFLNDLKSAGVRIPANYKYETHSCTSNLKQYQHTETYNPIECFKYAHGCLSKPKRIILFKAC